MNTSKLEQNVNTNTVNSKAIQKEFKSLEKNRQTDLKADLKAQKSLLGGLRTLLNFHNDKDKGLKLSTAQQTVIKSAINDNRKDVVLKNMGKRTLQKWNQIELEYHKFYLGNSKKQRKKIKALKDSTKDKELVAKKTKEVKAEMIKMSGGALTETDITVRVETVKEKQERSFTLRELLRTLNRIEAFYTVNRVKGMKSTSIANIEMCSGIFNDTKAKTA